MHANRVAINVPRRSERLTVRRLSYPLHPSGVNDEPFITEKQTISATPLGRFVAARGKRYIGMGIHVLICPGLGDNVESCQNQL